MKKISYIFIIVLSTKILYAQINPKNILLNKCLFSYTKLYPHLKGHKAFAYARVSLGEEDYCTWSHNASSIEIARTSALNACRQHKIDAKCKIIDINNTWLVKEGDFSTIIPPDNAPLPKEKYDTLLTQTKDLLLGECLSLFKIHIQDKGHKVFTYSVDADGKYACATTHSYQTLRQAALDALKRCEEKRTSMGKAAPKQMCLPFSDGKKILVSIQDYNLTLHKKTNKFPILKEYQDAIKEAKKTFLGSCLTQYKHYLRLNDHRAFYIAKDTKGSTACGYSFNQFTIASAKNIAYSKCKTSAKFKKIDATCIQYSLDLLSNEALEKKRITK